MKIDEQAAREHDFAEELGLLFEQSGAPRMMGRVVGWLLICDPPRQTAADLARALHASAGSISTTTRQLIQGNLIEKVAVRGDRRAWYQISEGAWTRSLQSKTMAFKLLRELAERGLSLLDHAPPTRRVRLAEMRDLHAFFEREFPRLIDQFHAEREAQRAAHGSPE